MERPQPDDAVLLAIYSENWPTTGGPPRIENEVRERYADEATIDALVAKFGPPPKGL